MIFQKIILFTFHTYQPTKNVCSVTFVIPEMLDICYIHLLCFVLDRGAVAWGCVFTIRNSQSRPAAGHTHFLSDNNQDKGSPKSFLECWMMMMVSMVCWPSCWRESCSWPWPWSVSLATLFPSSRFSVRKFRRRSTISSSSSQCLTWWEFLHFFTQSSKNAKIYPCFLFVCITKE